MGKFDVGIHALRNDAQIWDHQSGQMKQLAQKASALRMDALQSGVFLGIAVAYRSVVDQVVARSNEGSAAMSAVADTLSKVANAYQQDESQNTNLFRDLH